MSSTAFQFQPVGPVSGDTMSVIREILKDGTPDWVSHPEHYRSLAEEDRLMHKEQAELAAREYRVEDADLFEDERRRKVNIVSAKDFIRKLRANGVRCFAHENAANDGTAGLHAIVPTEQGSQVKAIAALQVPYMCEWSIGNFDSLGTFTGWKYIGWRDAVLSLIQKEVLTEEKAHEIFGAPSDPVASRRYRRILKALRQRKRKK